MGDDHGLLTSGILFKVGLTVWRSETLGAPVLGTSGDAGSMTGELHSARSPFLVE